VADWRDFAANEGWTSTAKTIRVPLGDRAHTVNVLPLDGELEFWSSVPWLNTDQLIALLVANRTIGLAYWHVENGQAWAVSRCSRDASYVQIVASIRATAALADRLELRLSDVDK